MCLEKVEPLVFRTHQWLAGSSRLTPLLCNIKAFSANFQVSNIWQVKLACGYTIKKHPFQRKDIYICIGRKYMYKYLWPLTEFPLFLLLKSKMVCGMGTSATPFQVGSAFLCKSHANSKEDLITCYSPRGPSLYPPGVGGWEKLSKRGDGQHHTGCEPKWPPFVPFARHLP